MLCFILLWINVVTKMFIFFFNHKGLNFRLTAFGACMVKYKKLCDVQLEYIVQSTFCNHIPHVFEAIKIDYFACKMFYL